MKASDIDHLLFKHSLHVAFFKNGEVCATLSFDAKNNYQVHGKGRTHKEAALDAISQVFEFAKSQAPHLINEDMLS